MSDRNPFREAWDRVMGMVADHQVEALSRSYCLAMRDERKARLRTIMELSVELAKIKAENIQATAFGEMIIEHVIEGDWKQVVEVNRLLTFEDHGERQVYYTKLWENFRAITFAACAEAAKRAAGQMAEPD